MTAEHIETSDGIFLAGFTERGLAALDFPGRSSQRQFARGADAASSPSDLRRWLQITREALESGLHGHKPSELPPFDWARGTAFQRKIWATLLMIEPGHTRSYAEVAQLAGHPKAVRAVGGACGANPIPVLVPCHRVLAAGGRIGGFSCGLEWKRRLLAREGVMLELNLETGFRPARSSTVR